MNKKCIFRIFIFFLIILMVTLDICMAMSIDELTGNYRKASALNAKGNKVITIISTIGSVISVVVLIILGLKYMLGSVEEKAEYKRTLMPFLIGALLIFCASTIASIIYNLAIQFK